ncbi:hypothetical protein D1604_12810 [Brevundimonas sp. LPMIX5]|uniref:hypothetical protein n=1 Tax=Brevundimonas sp. LPMIX5 TaxID=2305887 RepID=UPI000E676261|nr:hypothetical protein [Brevundimonas sp. LPMIX5]RIJ65193.1 hypothetical protein D1604_12810 [Brevundimonas sp. LPMIX5]
MAEGNVVGSAEFELRATRQKMKDDLRQAEADLKGFGEKAEQDIRGSSSRIGAGIGRMAAAAATAVTALVTVLGLAVAGAFNLGLAGQKMANDISDAAKRIGIGTDALQEWRYVAKQAGEDASAADRALESFAKKLSQATAGTSKEADKAFDLIKIGPEQLKSFKSTEEALDTVIDRIKGLKTEAERAAVAEALGLGSLSAALRDNAVDVAALRDEARQLGIVMDQEMVKRASEAQGQFDTLAQVIDVNLKSAFIDLAPVILTAISLVAELARTLADAMDAWRDLENKTSRGIRREDQQLAEEQAALISRYGSPDKMTGQIVRARQVEGASYRSLSARETGSVLARGAPNLPSSSRINPLNPPEYIDAKEHFDALNARRLAYGRELMDRGNRATPARTDRSDGGNITLPPTAPRRVAERADRTRDQARIREELELRNQLDLARAKGDRASIRAAEEKLDIARLTAAFERAGYEDAEFRATAQVAAMNEALAKNEQIAAWEKQSIEFWKELGEQARHQNDLLLDRLGFEAEIARLEGDPDRIKERERELWIEQRINDLLSLRPELTAEARRAQAENEWQRLDTADQTGRMRDEFRYAFTDGIKAAIDGDLGGFFDNLADRFTTRMLDNLADDLFDLLSEAAKGLGKEGGGFWSGIGSIFGFGGGRATGGAMSGGNWYRVGEHGPEDILMPQNGFAVPLGALSSGGSGQPQMAGGNTYQFSGNLMTPEFWRQIQGEIAAGEARAYGRAMNDAPKLTMSQTARQQRQAVGRQRRGS